MSTSICQNCEIHICLWDIQLHTYTMKVKEILFLVSTATSISQKLNVPLLRITHRTSFMGTFYYSEWVPKKTGQDNELSRMAETLAIIANMFIHNLGQPKVLKYKSGMINVSVMSQSRFQLSKSKVNFGSLSFIVSSHAEDLLCSISL